MGQSSARHSHKKQDEFVYIIEGEFVLVIAYTSLQSRGSLVRTAESTGKPLTSVPAPAPVRSIADAMASEEMGERDLLSEIVISD